MSIEHDGATYLLDKGEWYRKDGNDLVYVADEELILTLTQKFNDEASARVADGNVPGESKADRFKRLGQKRVKRAVENIMPIRHLANTSQYEYTEEQVAKIEALLLTTVNDTIKLFRKQKDAGTPVIEL